MTSRKPWPGWAADRYHDIEQGAQRLCRLARSALEPSATENCNAPPLAEQLQTMIEECRNIHHLCQQTQLQRQDDGRWPLWTIYALEDVTAIVIEAAALALGAAEDLRQNEPQATVEKGVTACLQAGQKIEQRLLEGPPPSENGFARGERIGNTPRFFSDL